MFDVNSTGISVSNPIVIATSPNRPLDRRKADNQPAGELASRARHRVVRQGRHPYHIPTLQ